MTTALAATNELIHECDADGCHYTGTWADWLLHAQAHALPHPDDRKAWLVSRRTFVGASEVPTLCGLNPYREAAAVYAAKVNPPAPEEMGTAQRLGQLFETPLLQDYADRHRVKLWRPTTQRLATTPCIAATPDADDGETLVQVKMVGARMMSHWENGPPAYVRVQVQTEMVAFARKRCVVLALLGGTDLEEYPIDFDPEVAGFAVDIAAAFWRDHVVPRQPPEGGSADDLRLIYPRQIRPLTMATPAERDLALQYKVAAAASKDAETYKDTISAQLCALIGDREGFTWPASADAPQGYASWKAPKGKTSWKGVATDLIGKFCTPQEGDYAIAEHTPAIGARTLLVNLKTK